MATPPVAIIIFRRPDLTRRVLEAVAHAKPEKLFVFADGPRPDHPEDVEACAAARALIDRVDWDCEVLRNFSDTNLGCGRGPSSGFSWVLDQVEEAIFLEDDCIPDASFFPFCGELLERYRDDERVMQISGCTYRREAAPVATSYYFSKFPACWGWATWRRAWAHFDFSVRLWGELKETAWLSHIVGDRVVENHLAQQFDGAFERPARITYWDYQWAFACWANSGLSIFPRDNLVTNLGCGTGATHTISENDPMINVPARDVAFPLRHPATVLPNLEVDRRYVLETIRPRLVVPKRKRGPLARLRRFVSRCSPAMARKGYRKFAGAVGQGAGR